jgi:hypothetical protein
MSWYNNTSTDFIDATQTFTGGSTSIVNGGDDVSNTPSGNITDLIQLVNNDTFVKNIYTDGRIYFYVKEADNDSGYNYNTRINNDGVLQYYHSYTALAPTKLSGFYNVGDAITGLETGAFLTGAIVATIQGEVTTLNTALITLNGEFATFVTTTESNIIDIYNLIHNLYAGGYKELADWRKSSRTRKQFRDLFTSLGGVVDNTTNLGGSTALTQIKKIQSSSATFFSIFINRFNNALTYAGIGAGLYGIYKILDSGDRDSQENDLLVIQRLRLDIEDNVANGDTSSQQVSHIYIDYLIIDQTTNNNFTTAGIYQSIAIQKGAELAIEIKDVSGTLKAEIVSVEDIGSGFSVNEEIFINKSDIGGTTGQLRIVVSQLASFEYILEQDEIKASTKLQQIDNRIRRRQYIPNKDDFGSGLNVTEIFTSEQTGESLSQISIDLKIDTSQFNYDASGNLQLTNYSQIAQNQTDIATNTANLSTIQGDISTIQGHISTNTANITTIQGDISTINSSITQIETDITNLQAGGGGGGDGDVYKLLLNNNETYSTTTDHIVNIGFNKTEFSGLLFNLIMGAVKTESGNVDVPFSITDFGGFYFGTYPNMERLNYNPTITLVKQDNTKYYNDTNWNDGGVTQLGAFYFKNLQDGFTYDLNKRFEFYGNIRFRTLQINANNYILRTALEYEESANVFNYSPDDNKMSFYYRNFRFYFRHLCKYNLTYYAINSSRNLLTDFLNPTATYTQATPAYGNSAGFKRLLLTTSPFNEDIYLWIKEAFYTTSQSVIDQLINTSTNTEPLFCGMLRNFSSGVHNPFGIVELTYPTYTSANLYKISRIDIEYKIMRNSGSYVNGIWVSAWVGTRPT